jgi:hypothetical protein
MVYRHILFRVRDLPSLDEDNRAVIFSRMLWGRTGESWFEVGWGWKKRSSPSGNPYYKCINIYN